MAAGSPNTTPPPRCNDPTSTSTAQLARPTGQPRSWNTCEPSWRPSHTTRSPPVKLANHSGRADVATASAGRFGPDPMDLYDVWDGFADFAETVTTGTGPLVEADLRNPVPRPRQVFAIGLNYRCHAEESGMAPPEVPAVFTKFP